MRVLFAGIGLAVTLAGVPIEAKTRFQQYEARNAVVEGQGGARTTMVIAE